MTNLKAESIGAQLAFDNAISKQAAAIKGIRSPAAGEADILLTPVLEARVTIMLTSRADSVEARLASCAVDKAYARWLRENRKAAHQKVTYVCRRQ